jgi:hypothetical protein
MVLTGSFGGIVTEEGVVLLGCTNMRGLVGLY